MLLKKLIRQETQNLIKTGVVVRYIAPGEYIVKVGGGRAIIKFSEVLKKGDMVSFSKMGGAWHFNKKLGEEGGTLVIHRP